MFLSPLTVFLLDLNLESLNVVPIRYLSEAYLLDKAGALAPLVLSIEVCNSLENVAPADIYLLLIVSVNGFHTTQIIQWFY